MIPTERQQLILQEVNQKHILSITELAKKLNVSHMTIRRDLQKLEEDGLLTQVSGGAKASQKLTSEPAHYVKEILYSDEKRRIGEYAGNMIQQNSCIYLDAGTTSLALAQHLKNRSDLTIVTNDFAVVNLLIESSKCNLIHVGGSVRSQNYSSVGFLAAQTIKSLRFDYGFISTSSFDINGVTTPDTDKIPVKKAVLEVSTKKILISDSSKYNCIATYMVFPLTDLDCIVTDTNLGEDVALKIERLGVNIVRV